MNVINKLITFCHKLREAQFGNYRIVPVYDNRADDPDYQVVGGYYIGRNGALMSKTSEKRIICFDVYDLDKGDEYVTYFYKSDDFLMWILKHIDCNIDSDKMMQSYLEIKERYSFCTMRFFF